MPETIFYSLQVIKINKSNSFQNRVLALSNKRIYNIKSENIFTQIFSKKKFDIRNSIKLGDLQKIVYSNESEQFILCSNSYDLLIESEE